MDNRMTELTVEELAQVPGGSLEDWIQWAIDRYHLNTTKEDVLKYIGDYSEYVKKYPGQEAIEDCIEKWKHEWGKSWSWSWN